MPFTFRELEAWKQGMSLVEECYKATTSFPKTETYGLMSQLRRAAVSIPANLAEGHARRSTRAFLNHISIAIGSQAELETCIELATRLRFVTAEQADRLMADAASVGRILYGLYRAIERKTSSSDLRPLTSDL